MYHSLEEYTIPQAPPLSPEQRRSPFAHFYEESFSGAMRRTLDRLKTDYCDPARALPFSHIEQLFTPHEPGITSGWCILPDGTGYSSLVTDMPGAAPEMERWWVKWAADPAYDWLNYRIMLPGAHEAYGNPAVDDPGWGRCQIYTEQPLFISLLPLSAPPRQLDASYVQCSAASGYCVPLDTPLPQPFHTVVLDCVKQTAQGLRVTSVLYFGVRWENGSLVHVHRADTDRVRLFTFHHALELQRKADLLPRLYYYASTLPETAPYAPD